VRSLGKCRVYQQSSPLVPTDDYSVISVRDFFYLELEFSCKLFLLPFIELSVCLE